MLTRVIVVVVFVLFVPSALAAHQWLFKRTDEVSARHWEWYQQRSDEQG